MLWIASGFTLDVTYPVVAWLCWVPNLVLAEWLLSRPSRSPRATVDSAARLAGSRKGRKV
ncbi:hypothetical protein GCM10023089_18490 [Quisquiliibacterium transsilvanicum]